MKPTTIETVRLGMTDLQVSPVAFGTWQLGGDWGDVEEQQSIDAIRSARALGVNFFDTAQGYGFGASEALLGTALRDDLDHHRDDVVLATKGGLRMTDDGLKRDSSPEWLRSGVEASLEALAVEHIDLYQVHWPDPDVPFAETAGALQELVQEGKIRHVGVSNFDAAQMADFAETWPVETLQPPYDLFRREIERELPYCASHDIGVLAYGPLAHGLLTGTMDENAQFPPGDWRGTAPFFKGDGYRKDVQVVRELKDLAEADLGISVSQLAIAWVLANPAVQIAIVGARSRGHIEDSIAASQVELSENELERIDQICAGAAPLPGPSPEMMPA
jgi:aryl-alcohol dehydrogenase-like predicted oxidoreductase